MNYLDKFKSALEERGDLYLKTDWDFDKIISMIDKQGEIEENMLILNRGLALHIDWILAKQENAEKMDEYLNLTTTTPDIHKSGSKFHK